MIETKNKKAIKKVEEKFNFKKASKKEFPATHEELDAIAKEVGKEGIQQAKKEATSPESIREYEDFKTHLKALEIKKVVDRRLIFLTDYLLTRPLEYFTTSNTEGEFVAIFAEVDNLLAEFYQDWKTEMSMMFREKIKNFVEGRRKNID